MTTWAQEIIDRGVDIAVPSTARMYDFFLGGSHNFAADRAAATEAMRLLPQIETFARSNRAFLRRAVEYLTSTGITQFLDLGSGIPTAGNVHHVARRSRPDARVVYVDHDAIAATMSRTLLAGDPLSGVVHADIRDTDTVLSHPAVTDRIRWDEPLGILAVAVLHFVSDNDHPAALIRTYQARAATGSHLVISHGSDAGINTTATATADVLQLYRSQVKTGATNRDAHQIAALFGDWPLIDPGLVPLPQWHPHTGHQRSDGGGGGEEPAEYAGYAGVATTPPPQ